MSTYKNQYKANNGFGDIKNNRAFNKQIFNIKRKEQRVENFAIKRNLEDVTDITTNIDNKDSRYYKLLKWKAERDRRKKMEQLQKKPAFKVGKVHHKYYSPPVKDSITLPPTKQCSHNQNKKMTQSTTPSKRVTRATQKRLLQKSMISNNVPQIQKIVEKEQKILTEKETEENSVKYKKSFAPNNYKFTAPSGLKNMPLFGRVAMLQSPVKALTSVNKETTADIFLSKGNSEMLASENDIAVKSNEKDKISDVDITNESIEAVTLKISSDEYEMTVDNSIKEGEFLQHSNLACKSHSPIISPSNVSLITAKQKTITEDKVNDDAEILSSKNIAHPEKNTSPMLNEINSPKTDPVYFSPYVVSSRGKSNARKEQQIRRGINCSLSEDIPTKETVMKTLNISIEEEERTAKYFSFLLNKETNRLNELCQKWTQIQSELGITEDAQYQINQAIGQTHLLINKKFERFRGLVVDCETGKGEMLVTCRDLQGFWDMMYIEIMNCDSRFKTLEKLRSNDWKEEEIAVTKVVRNKKVRSKKKIVPTKKSSVQDFILATKKKMKNKTENLKILKDHMNESIHKLSTSTNNIGIEQNKSEVSKMNKKTNFRQSLLKIELDDSISYINCKQTPSKSILKRTNDSAINETRHTKSVQKVNFDDHVISQEVPIDEEIQNKLDLATRLAKIDNYDLDVDYKNDNVKTGKKLNSNDNSFLNPEFSLQHNTCSIILNKLILPDATEKNNGTTLNLSTKLFGDTSSKNENVSLKELPNKFIQSETNIKILRNRVVVTDNSTRISTARRSNKGLADEDKSNQKENITPVKLERRSLNLSKQKESTTQKKSLNATPINLREDLRRSSRKSVRFNAEECRVCTEYKPIHPMTPHARRSKGNLNLSYLQQNISPIQIPSSNIDLITWDSPKILTRSSSRSSNKCGF